MIRERIGLLRYELRGNWPRRAAKMEHQLALPRDPHRARAVFGRFRHSRLGGAVPGGHRGKEAGGPISSTRHPGPFARGAAIALLLRPYEARENGMVLARPEGRVCVSARELLPLCGAGQVHARAGDELRIPLRVDRR